MLVVYAHIAETPHTNEMKSEKRFWHRDTRALVRLYASMYVGYCSHAVLVKVRCSIAVRLRPTGISNMLGTYSYRLRVRNIV